MACVYYTFLIEDLNHRIISNGVIIVSPSISWEILVKSRADYATLQFAVVHNAAGLECEIQDF